MNETEKQIKEIAKQFELLPIEAKRAVCWFAENVDLVRQIVDGNKIPRLEIEKYIEDAYNRKDYIMLVIILCKQRKDQNEIDNEKAGELMF